MFDVSVFGGNDGRPITWVLRDGCGIPEVLHRQGRERGILRARRADAEGGNDE